MKRHIHCGRSTRGLLDPYEVLEKVGLEKGHTFLDAGCGDGFISVAASRIVGAQGKVWAIDAYDDSIRALKEELAADKIRNVEAAVADLTRDVPVQAETIDVALLANILHGFVANGEAETVLGEIRRELRRGGTLAVVDFKKIEGTPGPPVEVRLTPQEVIKILNPHGFRRKTVADVGQYHYVVTFEKF